MSNARVELTRNPDDTWQAAVDGATIPIVDYTVEPAEDGLVLVSLTVAADQVSAGRSPASDLVPVEKPKLASVWQKPDRDPREGIAGWSERLGAQVAANAEAGQE